MDDSVGDLLAFTPRSQVVDRLQSFVTAPSPSSVRGTLKPLNSSHPAPDQVLISTQQHGGPQTARGQGPLQDHECSMRSRIYAVRVRRWGARGLPRNKAVPRRHRQPTRIVHHPAHRLFIQPRSRSHVSLHLLLRNAARPEANHPPRQPLHLHRSRAPSVLIFRCPDSRGSHRDRLRNRLHRQFGPDVHGRDVS